MNSEILEKKLPSVRVNLNIRFMRLANEILKNHHVTGQFSSPVGHFSDYEGRNFSRQPISGPNSTPAAKATFSKFAEKTYV